MKNFIRSRLEKIFGKKFTEYLFIIYKVLRNPKNFKLLFYSKKKDLKYNQDLFILLKKDVQEINQTIKNKLGIEYDDEKCSWHYHIFASLKTLDKINILEIGTYDGKFANFLSDIFPNGNIYTIDLPDEDQRFIHSYKREERHLREKFIYDRDQRLNKNNIFQIKMDSNNIMNKFKPKFFDLIWVDGDHREPQVSTDINNSIELINKNGVICCDDIIMRDYKDDYVSNESYLRLNQLEKDKIIKNNFFLKRCNRNNRILKKFISFSTLKNDTK